MSWTAGDIIAIVSIVVGMFFNYVVIKHNENQIKEARKHADSSAVLERTYNDKKAAFQNVISFILKYSSVLPEENTDWENDWTREYIKLEFFMSLYVSKDVTFKFYDLFLDLLSFTRVKIELSKDSETSYDNTTKLIKRKDELSAAVTEKLYNLSDLMNTELNK